MDDNGELRREITPPLVVVAIGAFLIGVAFVIDQIPGPVPRVVADRRCPVDIDRGRRPDLASGVAHLVLRRSQYHSPTRWILSFTVEFEHRLPRPRRHGVVRVFGRSIHPDITLGQLPQPRLRYLGELICPAMLPRSRARLSRRSCQTSRGYSLSQPVPSRTSCGARVARTTGGPVVTRPEQESPREAQRITHPSTVPRLRLNRIDTTHHGFR